MKFPFRKNRKPKETKVTDMNKIATQSDSRRFVDVMIEKPRSQLAEVLFELMAEYKSGATRRDLMIKCHCLNAPQTIRSLRAKGADIITQSVEHINKYGHPIKYGRYYLVDFKNALKVYNSINRK